ncbi:hypothetical protein INT48_008404 [Thamnidium elegans]|uniref:Uncharacterized protein n=1 Tax=Thamnidium elegans TaxID=101142 RepID=A0A8H7VYU0_9FUNG|nr:hypothetical protein INT48_008404 [Thamnidium elegans]
MVEGRTPDELRAMGNMVEVQIPNIDDDFDLHLLLIDGQIHGCGYYRRRDSQTRNYMGTLLPSIITNRFRSEILGLPLPVLPEKPRVSSIPPDVRSYRASALYDKDDVFFRSDRCRLTTSMYPLRSTTEFRSVSPPYNPRISDYY